MSGPVAKAASRGAAVRRRAAVALAGVLSAVFLPGFHCSPPPSLPPTDCWVHTGGTVSPCALGASEQEPNGDVSSANLVPYPACGMTGSLSGILGGDVDVFRFDGARCSGSQPTATLHTADSSIRLCLFASCDRGKTGLTGCSAGAVATHLPMGMLGCCVNPALDAGAAPGGEVSLDVNCDGDVQFGDVTPQSLKPSLSAFVVVDGGDFSCSGYDVSYHY